MPTASQETRDDAGAEYRRRLAARREAAAGLARREGWISLARLATAVAAALLGWAAWRSDGFSPWWLALPAILFLGLVVLHERAIRARRRAQRAARYYERGLDRLEDRWAGTGEPGDRFLDPAHLYAADLDLFGPGSLFERIGSARTRAGEVTLARWLSEPADPDTIRSRQEAVEDLRSRLDVREDLALLGEEVRAGVHPEDLERWGAAPADPPPKVAVAAAPILATITAGCLIAWGIGAADLALPGAAAIAQALFAFVFRSRVLKVVAEVETPGRDLALVSAVLERFETERFTSTLLTSMQEGLAAKGIPPSRRIAALERLIQRLDYRRNQLFAPLGALMLWTTQVAWAVERWRAASGPQVGRWLAAIGEFEALSSLAGYAYENPGDPFPEIVIPPEGGPLFEAEALGHPLIPAARCVRNDLALNGSLRLLIVSGSNMSGKSTLLRATGANAALAMAGAPVRARRLRLSPVAVGASIRIQDSLREGTSRFYAEITRLAKILELARGPLPVMFLVDEMLHGTNSHDRRIGAEAVTRSLVERGAAGLITTHDLALAQIADALAPRSANVHFQDHMEGGRIRFDYVMRPGVVTKSNALDLMRAVGLELDRL